MRYRADITAGSLKVAESRIIADMLLRGIDEEAWREAIVKRNILQVRNIATAIRIARLIHARLALVKADLWKFIRDDSNIVATQAVFAAAIKHSALLGDFLDLVVREQYRLFNKTLPKSLWDGYLEGCRSRDGEMPLWTESTRERLRSTVFQTLSQAGYLESTKTLILQPVHISAQVISYLQDHNEEYVLRCIQVSP